MTRLSIGAIGAGRVGAVMAAALRSAGHPIAAVSGTSHASRLRIETLLPGVAVASPAEVARRSDLVLLAVPDDALASVVDELVASHALRPGHVLVHTSGRHGTAVLEAATRRGVRTIALHPAMTFTGTDIDLDRLAGCVFAITADPRDREVAESLVAAVGGRSMWLDEEQRTLYHAALTHGANHLVTLVSQARSLLLDVGADDPSTILRPLLSASLDNALAYGDAALTGPVARGDVSTVQAHVDALQGSPPATLDAYVEMARATTEHAVAAGRITRTRGRDLARVLDEADWDTLAQIAAGIG